MKWWDRVKQRPFWIRLLNWEYWPSKAYYFPLIPLILWQMLRSRHLCFFTAANPGIYTGGIGLESKYETLLKIPGRYRPRSILFRKGDPTAGLPQRLQQAGIRFPLIAKPDLGFRGLLVKKLGDEAEMMAYLKHYPIDFILQEFIALPEEAGVLYHRMPGEERGRVTSITTKEFLYVTGDGRSTVEALIRNKPRALLQMERIRAGYPALLPQVPAAGEKVGLGVVGNHSKGTRFINSNHLIDEAVCRNFDRISQEIEGFYYGRFDIKCESLDALFTGEGMKVIELNGACSEPTHIYDPERGTYWAALRDIAYHWRLIRRIARANHQRGVPYLPHKTTAREFLHLFAYQRLVRGLEEGGLRRIRS